MAPPITVAAHNGTEIPLLLAMMRAIGASMEMVPTLVPMDIEMTQAIKKIPTREKSAGMMLRSRFAVLMAPPAAVAMPLNAPAKRNMRSMMVTLVLPIPLAQTLIFSSKESLRFCIKAVIRAIPKDTTTEVM